MQEEITKESILELSNKIVDYALSKNVDAVEVYSQYSLNMQIMTEGLAIANERAKEELGFAIRVIIEESEGFSYESCCRRCYWHS